MKALSYTTQRVIRRIRCHTPPLPSPSSAAKYCDECICLSVCLSLCLLARITLKPPVQTTPIFLWPWLLTDIIYFPHFVYCGPSGGMLVGLPQQHHCNVVNRLTPLLRSIGCVLSQTTAGANVRQVFVKTYHGGVCDAPFVTCIHASLLASFNDDKV